jgi:shikimate dehydrogenase
MSSDFAAQITGATRVFCIVGDPVAPLRSPVFFNSLFRKQGVDAVFVALQIGLADAEIGFAGLRAMRNIAGMVVTMPLKQRLLPLLDEALPGARQCGAVNTIRREADGRLVGDMFDGKGGVLGLRWNGHEPRGKSVLLVGAGGAGSALAFALAEAGVASLTMADLDARRAADIAERVRAVHPGCAAKAGVADPRGHAIVVNATPLGMKPGDKLPIDPDLLAPGTVVFDIITNPDPSPLMTAAQARGCPAIGGARHDHPLDLVGAFVDLRDLRVAIQPLDRHAADVAGAAMDLHRIRGARDRRRRRRSTSPCWHSSVARSPRSSFVAAWHAPSAARHACPSPCRRS